MPHIIEKYFTKPFHYSIFTSTGALCGESIEKRPGLRLSFSEK